ncbi:hypothetical protein [Hymenobacter elongatus]|uniref:Lipoprotein n=1 Tax=Hymenobacter elongatus TaxID=877208 RepID=A0A4Z0PM66_9BACT|nr:hypothetical protein [Hymenobacter elongatus]TGE16821.1 hypothetical protein E5J99_08915 [Hymenobacter elongatus]
MNSYFSPVTSLKALGLLAAGMSLMVSCSKDQVMSSAAPTPTPTSVADTKYSGEELFQGIFMVQGPVADRIPYLALQRSAMAKESRQHTQERQAAMRQITTFVKELDPGYFADLADAVASQDFSRIETALRKGAALHYSAVQKIVPRQLATKAAGQPLDLAAYDFSKQADLERYIKDSQLANTGVAQQEELEQPLVIEGYVMQLDWGLYPGPMMQFQCFVPNGLKGSTELTEAMQKRASLETDKLVRDIAFVGSRKG